MSRRHYHHHNHHSRVDLAEKLKQKEDNPIGALQTICTHFKWQSPIYKQVGECGLPHQKEYALSVSVNCYNLFGVGFSKRDAKKNAALKMCEYLKPIILENESNQENVSAQVCQTTSDKKLLWNRNGECYKDLISIDFEQDFNCMEFLCRLSKEQSFVTFYISNHEIDSTYEETCVFMYVDSRYCFVDKGRDLLSAKNNVAKQALQFLQLIQKKNETID